MHGSDCSVWGGGVVGWRCSSCTCDPHPTLPQPPPPPHACMLWHACHHGVGLSLPLQPALPFTGWEFCDAWCGEQIPLPPLQHHPSPPQPPSPTPPTPTPTCPPAHLWPAFACATLHSHRFPTWQPSLPSPVCLGVSFPPMHMRGMATHTRHTHHHHFGITSHHHPSPGGECCVMCWWWCGDVFSLPSPSLGVT